MSEVIRAGERYKHSKSGNIYEIVGLGRREEDLTLVVLYKPLELAEVLQPATCWARPYEEFIEDIELNGKLIPRFELLT